MDGTLIDQKVRIWSKSWYLVFGYDCHRTLWRWTTIFEITSSKSYAQYCNQRPSNSSQQIFKRTLSLCWLLFEKRSFTKMVSNLIVKSWFYSKNKDRWKTEIKSDKNVERNEEDISRINNKNRKGLIFNNFTMKNQNLFLQLERMNCLSCKFIETFIYWFLESIQ